LLQKEVDQALKAHRQPINVQRIVPTRQVGSCVRALARLAAHMEAHPKKYPLHDVQLSALAQVQDWRDFLA
jgi:hypothetical protein